MDTNFIVYAFHVPGETKPFYVGKGRPNRPAQHFQETRWSRERTLFYAELQRLIAIGIWPQVKIIAQDLSEDKALDIERSLIRAYGRRDLCTGCLCNHTDGGDGSCSNVSESTRLAFRKGKLAYAKPVESFDRQTGQAIKQYETMRAVGDDGFQQTCVCQICKGNGSHHKGLGWRYI